MHLCGRVAGAAARAGPAAGEGDEAGCSEGEQEAGASPAFRLHPEKDHTSVISMV